MKQIAANFFRGALRLSRHWRSRGTLAKLMAHASPQVAAIAKALAETGAKHLDHEEEELLARIEQRRNFLLQSNRTIAFIDYGAGDPHAGRSEAEMNEGVRSELAIAAICKFSKSALWALLLFKIIRLLKPLSCLELGACLGISASYQAAALSLNKRGRIVTLEGSPEIAKIAEETLKGLQLDPFAEVRTGPFYRCLQPALLSANPIDFLFNDGHHDHDALLKYFNMAFPFLAEDAVIVFDDISWSPGMRRAWMKIRQDERVGVTIDLRTIGIALLSKKFPKQDYMLFWP